MRTLYLTPVGLRFQHRNRRRRVRVPSRPQTDTPANSNDDDFQLSEIGRPVSMTRKTANARVRSWRRSPRRYTIFLPVSQGRHRRRPAATDPVHGHAQTDPDTFEVRHQHPEDHAVHEDGVGRQVRARRTRTAPGPPVRRWRQGKMSSSESNGGHAFGPRRHDARPRHGSSLIFRTVSFRPSTRSPAPPKPKPAKAAN